MCESAAPQDQTPHMTDGTGLLADIKQHAEVAATASADIASLLNAAQGNAQSIAMVRADGEKSKAQLDAMLETAKGTIAELSQQASETVAQANASLETLRTHAEAASASASRIEVLKDQVEQSAEVAAQRSKHIEDGRRYVDEKRAEIDGLLTTAKQSATNTEAQHQAARTSIEQLTEFNLAVQKRKADAERDSEAIASLLDDCNQHAETMKALAEKATTTETRIADYESRLAQLETTAKERLTTIESLLPGAASAGLASAFNQRRAHFKWPQRVWQGVFVFSLIALLAIAGLEFIVISKVDGPLTWDRLGLSLLHRLPFALPLIWLAIHSGHKAALAQRVEEDYAFKETVSRSFEGYRREMAELEGKAAPNSALARLCAGVLGVITNPPGRIYEKHPLNNTPLSALADSAGPIASAATKAAKGQAGL